MALPELPLLLKTCVKHDALCMHLLPDHVPGLQLPSGWRGLQIPPADRKDIQGLATELRTLSQYTRSRLKRMGLDENSGSDRFFISFGSRHIFRVIISTEASEVSGIWLEPLRPYASFSRR